MQTHRCPGGTMPHRLRASRLRRQVSETYHGTLTRLRVGARERYHKLSDLGLTGLPNVTKEAAPEPHEQPYRGVAAVRRAPGPPTGASRPSNRPPRAVSSRTET